MPAVTITPSSTLSWTADPDATRYQFRRVAVGADPDDGAAVLADVPDHNAVTGSTAGSMPVGASNLIATATDGSQYDIYVRGYDSAGNPSPWSAALLVQVSLSLVDPVTDLTVT